MNEALPLLFCLKHRKLADHPFFVPFPVGKISYIEAIWNHLSTVSTYLRLTCQQPV